MATTSEQPSSRPSFILHPLFLLTVSDHRARISLGSSPLPKDHPAVGLCFGTSTPSALTILDGQPIKLLPSGLPDLPSLDTQLSLHQACFPTRDIVGWYSSSPNGLNVLEIHKAMKERYKCSLHVSYSPSSTSGSSFEARTLAVMPTGTAWISHPVTYSSHLPEKVAVSHVASNQSSSDSPRVKALRSVENGMAGVAQRMDLIVRYLDEVEGGKVKVNVETLAKVAAVLNQRPVGEGVEGEDDGTVEALCEIVKAVKGFEDGMEVEGRAFG